MICHKRKLIILYLCSSYANSATQYERSVDYAFSHIDNPLKSNRYPLYEDKSTYPDQSHQSLTLRTDTPSNYGEFVTESLVSISSSKGSKPYVAKEELNLLAKLVGCDERNDDSEETCKKFKINLFETAGVDVTTNSSIDT